MFTWLKKNNVVNPTSIRETLGLVESVSLLFPTVVTLLAAVTFLFGGSIGVWQWWCSVGGILGYFTWRRNLKQCIRISAGILFLLLLVYIYIATNVLCYSEGIDNSVYHFPAIRLLVNGWNPVYAATPDTLASSMAIDPWGMRLWHVLSVSKTTWYFNAVANTFTNTPLNLLLPLFPFLFIGAAGQVWRLLRGWNVWIKLAGVVLLYTLSPGVSGITDAALFLGGVGLLSAMTRYLRGEKGTTLPLILLSFWMMTTKMPGLLSCFVFWVCFSVVLIFRHRCSVIPYLAKLGSVLTLLFAIACASPYITSAIHYGHPLYPAYSGDEEHHPVHDITADFRMANDDAKAMGHLGSFVNAYLSPTLARAYYRWKLNQETFAPNRYVWWQGHTEGGEPLSPLNTPTRLILLGSFLIVLILGKQFRFITGTTLLGILCIPTCYLGFTRYIAWIDGLYLLAMLLILNALCTRLTRYWKQPLIWTCLCGAVMLWHVRTLPLAIAVRIDYTYALKSYFATTPPSNVYCHLYSAELLERVPQGKIVGRPEVFGDPSQTQLNDVRLLCATIPTLKATRIHPLSFAEETAYRQIPGTAMRVAPDIPLPETELAKINALPVRKERLIRYPLYIIKMYTVVLPQSIGETFCTSSAR